MAQGSLYIVATPIGNLGDISKRAIDVLTSVDLIAAEDTRHSGNLLRHLLIKTPMISLHEFNERDRCEKIIENLRDGKNVAMISDAGTPLISDPGFHLVQAVRDAGFPVIPIPGACAAITALSAAGLSSRYFVFEGFLPAKQQERIKRLSFLAREPRTIIFYVAPHRILNVVEDMVNVFGGERKAVIARELTKVYETIHGDALANLLSWLQADSKQQQGEFVVLVDGASEAAFVEEEIIRILTLLLEEMPINQAARLAAKITHRTRKELYDLALRLQGK